MKWRNDGTRLMALCVAMWCCVSGARADEQINQFSLASLSDWNQRRGFFLIVDNRFDGRNPSPLHTAKIVLAVGDGKDWHFLSTAQGLELRRNYHLRFNLAPQRIEFWVNDVLVDSRQATLLPLNGDMTANDAPEWANHPAQYRVRQESLRLFTPQRVLLERELGKVHDVPLAALAFMPPSPMRIGVEMPAQPMTLTIETQLELVEPMDLQKLGPMVDRFGQATFADWPGKVRDLAELRRSMVDEEERLRQWEVHARPYDKFGGRTDLGWKMSATGYFYVAKRHDVWWLISPQGHPTFFTGLGMAPALDWDATPVSGREFMFEALPPRDGLHERAWSQRWGDGRDYLAPQAANLIAKFGQSWWEDSEQLAIRRMKAWGFAGMGKWTGIGEQTQMPVLNRDRVRKLDRHPDIFDTAARAELEADIARQIGDRAMDPWIVGFSLGNEFGEVVTRQEIHHVMTLRADTPAKRALIDHALATIYGNRVLDLAEAWQVKAMTSAELYATQPKLPPGDTELLRQFFADRYFAFVYQVFKKLAPNHLYLGHWLLPGWWENENDWLLMARHCDVIGFDAYEATIDEPIVARLIALMDKPVLCGEFGFPAYYQGKRGYGRFKSASEDDADMGRKYARWIEAAATNRRCVGGVWFQYRDQPITGRGPMHGPVQAVHGENFAFGLVTVTDVPKQDALEHFRKANLQAALWRAALRP